MKPGLFGCRSLITGKVRKCAFLLISFTLCAFAIGTVKAHGSGGSGGSSGGSGSSGGGHGGPGSSAAGGSAGGNSASNGYSTSGHSMGANSQSGGSTGHSHGGNGNHGTSHGGFFGFGGHAVATSHTVTISPAKPAKTGKLAANLDPAMHSPSHRIAQHHHRFVTQHTDTGGGPVPESEYKKKASEKAVPGNGLSPSSVSQR
jgi:hypothetical protein